MGGPFSRAGANIASLTMGLLEGESERVCTAQIDERLCSSQLHSETTRR